jgi:hypothetical protein
MADLERGGYRVTDQPVTYAHKHLEDPPEIRDWVWSDCARRPRSIAIERARTDRLISRAKVTRWDP